MLKVSEYNFIWPIEDNEYAVIYNSFTGAAMELNKKYLGLLEKNSQTALEPEEQQNKLANELKANGFLIDEYIDERKILKYRNYKEKYSREILSLTILPTFCCNLKCFYCYEDRTRIENMTPQVEEKVLEFVSKSLLGVKKIHVCWFGGEPLVAWDTIRRMTKKLLELAEENNCSYTATMVSNGYLLDDDKISSFKELRIDNIQITLDGTPALHSARKGIKGDPDANFHFILQNIRKLLEAKIKVRIRINIDKNNVSAMEELLALLSKAELKDAFIYPAMIEPYTKLCSDVENTCLRRDEFKDVVIRFHKMLLEKGLKKDLSEALPTPKGNSCVYDQINSYSIAPDGYVYKCWNTIGNKEAAIADVLDRDGEDTEKKRQVMRKIENMTWDPFENPECMECKLLPVCMGGCPYRYETSGGSEPDCLTVKDTIKENVINHVLSIKINQLFQC
jgi:uncharacterized protein